jgi:hypothetical protein
MDGGQRPSRLQLGGSFSANVLPTQENENYSLNNNAVDVTSTTKSTSTGYGPDLFLDIPGFFQAGFLMNFSHFSATYGLSSSNPAMVNGQSAYPEQAEDDISGTVLYKIKLPMDTDGNPHPLRFNHGIYFGWSGNQNHLYDPNGNQVTLFRGNQYQLQFGLGLERECDFMLGFQVIETAQNLYSQIPPLFINQNNYSSFTHLTLGGEKWVTPHWAFRGGLTYLDEKPGNQSPEMEIFLGEDFFYITTGQEITGFLPTAGVGYQDGFFKGDAMFWFEQPQSSGAGFTGPTYEYTVYGAQLSLAVFL